MPNIQSSKKRVLTSRKARLRNRKQKSELKNTLKKFNLAVQQNDVETADALLVKSQKLLDKSVTSNIQHKNYATRRKSDNAFKYNTLAK